MQLKSAVLWLALAAFGISIHGSSMGRVRLDDSAEVKAIRDRIKATSPTDPIRNNLQMDLANALYKSGDFQAASAEFQSLSEIAQPTMAAEAKFWVGVCLHDLKKYSEASIVMESFEKDNPKSPRAARALLRAGISSTYDDNGDYRALKLFARVRENYPNGEEATEATKRIAIIANNTKQIVVLERAVSMLPESESSSAHLKLADAYAHEGNTTKVEKQLKLVKESALTANEKGRYAILKTKLAITQGSVADKATLTTIADGTDDPRSRSVALSSLARLSLKQGDVSGSRSSAKKAIANGANGEALIQAEYTMLVGYFKESNWAEVVATAKSLSDRKPTGGIKQYAEFAFARGTQGLGRKLEAEGLWRTFLKNYPSSDQAPFANVFLAMLEQGSGKAADALIRLQTVIAGRKNPEALRAALWDRARLYYGMGRYMEAAADYDRLAIVEKNPDDLAQSILYAGEAYRAGGNNTIAAARFRTVIKQFPRTASSKTADDRLASLPVRQ